MARGWESKSVEAQMETSQSKKEESGKKRRSPESIEAIRKRETLLLAQAHLQQQIQLTRHTRRLEMLQTALVDLEKQLAEIDVADPATGTQ